MSKKDAIDFISAETGLLKSDVDSVLKAFTGFIATEVLENGNSVGIVKFGTFKLKELKARTGRNPSTGETMQFKGSKSMTFHLSNGLRKKDE